MIAPEAYVEMQLPCKQKNRVRLLAGASTCIEGECRLMVRQWASNPTMQVRFLSLAPKIRVDTDSKICYTRRENEMYQV